MMQTKPPTLEGTARKPEVVMSSQESKDVRRVFDHLAGCAKREIKKLALKKTKEIHEPLMVALREAGGSDEANQSEQAEELEVEIYELETELKQMEAEQNKKITARDLDYALKSLGKKLNRKDVEVGS